MNRPALNFLLLVLAAAGPAAFGAAERFDTTKAHLDALLERHTKAEPLPAKPANPFLYIAPGTLVAPTEKTPAVEPAPSALADDDQILAFCAARLRIGGQVQRGGVAHLLVNSATYREGDLIPVRGNGDTVYYVRVVKIAPTEAVFGYNDSVLTLPLRG